MSTFERAKQKILRDMESCSAHTAESWARIMLSNTKDLVDPAEQAKFWVWCGNPTEDESVKKPILGPMPELLDLLEPTYTVDMVDENNNRKKVAMQQEHKRNGFTTYIRTGPKKPENDEKTED